MFRSKFVLLSLAIFTVVVTSLIARVPSRAVPPAPGWVINQQCQFHGPIEIQTGAQGAKLLSKDLSIYLLPNSEARIYSSSNRTFCAMSQQLWQDKFSVGATPGGPVKRATAKMFGLNATQYFSGLFNRQNKMLFTVEYWCTNDMNIPKQVMNDYATLMGLPKGVGMPLKIVRHYGADRDNKVMLFLETKGIRPAVVAASDLTPPTGYRKVKDEMEVFLSDDADDLGAILGDTGSKNSAPKRSR